MFVRHASALLELRLEVEAQIDELVDLVMTRRGRSRIGLIARIFVLINLTLPLMSAQWLV